MKNHKKLVKPNNFGTSTSLKLLTKQEALHYVHSQFTAPIWLNDEIDTIIENIASECLEIDSKGVVDKFSNKTSQSSGSDRSATN
jgi:dTDP-4-dehydrorhamnose reductase